jgi:hypothetical protein
MTSFYVPDYIANSIKLYMEKKGCNKSTALRELLAAGINWVFFMEEEGKE